MGVLRTNIEKSLERLSSIIQRNVGSLSVPKSSCRKYTMSKKAYTESRQISI